MAKATFHSLRGETSALVLIKANDFEFSAKPVYIPRKALKEGITEGDTFNIPDGFSLVDFVDPETGEVRTTKNGEPLKILSYS